MASFGRGSATGPPLAEFVCVRKKQQALLKEQELIAPCRRWLEQVRAQFEIALIQPQPVDGQAESERDLIGVRTLAALPRAPLGCVILAAVHAAQQVDDARGALGKFAG